MVGQMRLLTTSWLTRTRKIGKMLWRWRKRLKRFWQRVTRGWDDSDLWSLDMTIAKFALPRLARFRQIDHGYPVGMTAEQWDESLADMEYALRSSITDDKWFDDDIDWDRVSRGLESFGKNFRHLWW